MYTKLLLRAVFSRRHLDGDCAPIPSHRAKSHDFAVGGLPQQVTAGVQMHCQENQTLILERRTHATDEEKSETYRKDKSNLARVTETVHELLRQQAEDAE